MAIDDFTFQAIWEAKVPNGEILCLGYPDILVHAEITGVGEHTDADRIRGWHGWNGRVYDAGQVFSRMGLRPTYIDLVRSRGAERIEDLNLPLATDLAGRFDIVLDPGTVEHCFNVGQAFRNVRDAAKPGGIIIHENPLSMVNHGFWNINPGTYHDFYDQDTVHLCAEIYGEVNKKKIEVIRKPFARTVPHDNASILVVVEKGAGGTAWPLQRKYRHNPNLMAPAA